MAQEPLAPHEIAERARPAVVFVTAHLGSREIGQGSGFIVDASGTIVTNRHVIMGADRLRVRLASGEIYDRVFVVSDDARRDLVILRIPATGLAALSIGDDRGVGVGERVYVMGNPLGFEHTFSDGLVSARRIVDGNSLIQITAPISSGSSGGPVLNAAGEVIGVATATLRDGQNLNLAVPARYAEGMLPLAGTPQPFEAVAGRFAEEVRSDERATREGRGDDDIALWERVLLQEMEAVRDVADEHGLVLTHEPIIEMLREGRTYRTDITYSTRGRVMVVGVCDVDCDDLDLTVYDGAGRLVGRDVTVSDRPVVEFDVTRTGRFEIVVRMASCDVNPCGFAVMSYRRAAGRR